MSIIHRPICKKTKQTVPVCILKGVKKYPISKLNFAEIKAKVKKIVSLKTSRQHYTENKKNFA